MYTTMTEMLNCSNKVLPNDKSYHTDPFLIVVWYFRPVTLCTKFNLAQSAWVNATGSVKQDYSKVLDQMPGQ